MFLGGPVLVFVTYGIVLLYYARQKNGVSKESGEHVRGVKFEPRLSVVIPTHNEASIISRRIDNLLALDYPQEKTEIIIVDDSSDSTPGIIREYMERSPQIRLIRFDRRMGYSPCLIAGCSAATGEIVVFGEAGSFMDSKAIRYLVNDLRRQDIGVVTGRDVILNLNEEMGKSEDFYLKILHFVRTAESNMDSTIYMKGEAAAVRKDLIADLQDLERFPGTADTGIALLSRKKGYRAIYDPRATFYEYAPSTRKERVRQKVTRGANLIKVLWAFRGMFFRRKYGKFGIITLPIGFVMLTFVPLSLLMAIFLLAILTLMDPASCWTIWFVTGSLFLLALAFSKRFVFTFLEFEYSLLKALFEILFVRKSHDKIEKATSTREAKRVSDIIEG